MFISVAFLFALLAISNAEECPALPDEIGIVEMQCAELPNVKGGLLERIENTAKTLFEKAKHELGIKSDEPKEPRKCQYYQCVLQTHKLLDGNGVPTIELFKNFINGTMDESVVQTCLENINQHDFTCDESTEFIKCLTIDAQCPVFTYP